MDNWQERAAYWSARLGVETFPVSGKRPAGGHSHTKNTIHKPGVQPSEDWPLATGFGCMYPEGSGGCVIEYDNPAAGRKILTLAPSLGKTFAVQSGSGRGVHWYCYAPGLTNKSLTDENDHELASTRAFGKYVVGPESIHPASLKPYKVLRDVPPVTLPIEEVNALKTLFGVEKEPSPEPVPYTGRTIKGDALKAYGLAALDHEERDLSALSDGQQRFKEIYRAAYRLGTLVPIGALTENDIHNALIAAAERNGYVKDHGRGLTEHHIRSGIENGKLKPRVIPENTQYVPTPTKVKVKAQPESPFPNGLPIEMRGMLNAFYPGCIAPTLEVWYEGIAKGMIDPHQPVNADYLICTAEELRRFTSKAVIRAALKNPVAKHFFRFVPHYIFTDRGVVGEGGAGDACYKVLGRPSEYYELVPHAEIINHIAEHIIDPLIQQAFPNNQPLVAPIRTAFLEDLSVDEAERITDELINRYGDAVNHQAGYAERMRAMRKEYDYRRKLLANPKSAPIPAGWHYRTSSEYVACCARALAESEGGTMQHKREHMCRLIGCKDNMLPTVMARAGIAIEKHQYVDREIKSVNDVNFKDKSHGAYVGVYSSGWKKVQDIKGDWKTFVNSELATGRTVYVRCQMPNKYRIITDRQPEKVKDEAPVAEPAPVVEVAPIQMSLVPEEPTPTTVPTQDEIDELVRTEEDFWREIAKGGGRITNIEYPVELEEAPVRTRRPKQTYAGVWLEKLTELVTPVAPLAELTHHVDHADDMVNRETGELLPRAVQTCFDALLSPTSPP